MQVVGAVEHVVCGGLDADDEARVIGPEAERLVQTLEKQKLAVVHVVRLAFIEAADPAVVARERGVSLTGLSATVFCVGPRSALAAREAGMRAQRLPEGRFDAQGVLEEVRRVLPARGRRFLIPRSEAAREVLSEGLRADGASVDAVVAYRNLPADVDAASLRSRLVRGELDVLSFASPSSVRRFSELLDADSRDAARDCVVAAIGPVTADALRDVGLPPHVTSPVPEVQALVAALSAFVAEARESG